MYRTFQITPQLAMMLRHAAPMETSRAAIRHVVALQSGVVFSRAFSGPPVKSYNAFKSPLSLALQRVPPVAKYFSGILTAALGMTHLHPNTVVTVGPPIAVLGFFAYRRFQHAQYLKLVALVKPQNGWADQDWKVRIQNYDETDVQNVLSGIENQYDNFHVQVMELVEKRIVDYVVQRERTGAISPVISLLLDENKQVVVHLGDPETYVSLRAEAPNEESMEKARIEEATELVDLIRFSVPFYSSGNTKLRKRLGVAEVTLMQVPGTESAYTDYRVCIELTLYKMFSRETEAIGAIEGAGIYVSEKMKKLKSS